MVGDGTWLTIGEVLAKLRAEGFTDSESTVRRMIDDGLLRSHRTGKGHRRVKATSVDELIASRNQPEKDT